jgi:hypothetical protein
MEALWSSRLSVGNPIPERLYRNLSGDSKIAEVFQGVKDSSVGTGIGMVPVEYMKKQGLLK